ncbi:MAG: pantothenate kinase [Rivularia sp. ALOHA_DT_140]|nr:pantothenate kinase [Rivularia sp. ALOHA_DT_140]
MLSDSKTWLALAIGNSRLHWGLFNQNKLTKSWDTNYLSTPSPPSTSSPSVFIASVVPSQTELWKNYPKAYFINLNQIPLNNLYSTLGIDRALSLFAAGETWNYPILVIDAGTAMTFTGADNKRNLIGGAILPGLGLQFSTLTQKTGQLPKVELPQQLPLRYAINTPEAIQSGIIYTLIAGIKDFIQAWLKDFPHSNVVMTGGNSILLFNYLKSQYPEIAESIILEKNLVLWGIQRIVIKSIEE